MNVHLIIDHPWSGSFNYAVLYEFTAGLQEAGHSVDVLDLNQDQFNPVISEAELAGYSQGISLDPKINCTSKFIRLRPPGDDLPHLVERYASQFERLDGQGAFTGLRIHHRPGATPPAGPYPGCHGADHHRYPGCLPP